MNSGPISVISASGSRRTLIEGLPSGTDVTGGASGPTDLALRGNRLYVAIGAGDTERRNEQGVTVPNPQGPSSTLLASVLVFDLSSSADLTTDTFRLTAADRTEVSDGYSVKLEDGVGASATISLLARFPFAEPDRGTVNRFSNLWGMTLSGDSSILYVADASENSLLSVDTATGRRKRVVRFAQNPNPTPVGPPVDVASRTSTPFLTGLTTVTDVLVRQTGGDRPTFSHWSSVRTC